MIRPLMIAAALALAAPAAHAQSQLEIAAQRALNDHGFSTVNAGSLTTSQRATIVAIANSKQGNKRVLIRSAINRDNLRSLFR